MFDFLCNFVLKTFLVLGRTQPDTVIKHETSFKKIVVFFFQIVTEFGFFNRILIYSSIKFHENPYRWGRVVPCWQTDERTDRHNEANGHFAQFTNATKTNNFLNYI